MVPVPCPSSCLLPLSAVSVVRSAESPSTVAGAGWLQLSCGCPLAELPNSQLQQCLAHLCASQQEVPAEKTWSPTLADWEMGAIFSTSAGGLPRSLLSQPPCRPLRLGSRLKDCSLAPFLLWGQPSSFPIISKEEQMPGIQNNFPQMKAILFYLFVKKNPNP